MTLGMNFHWLCVGKLVLCSMTTRHAGVESGAIRHVPSASDLMKQIMPEAVAKVRLPAAQRLLLH